MTRQITIGIGIVLLLVAGLGARALVNRKPEAERKPSVAQIKEVKVKAATAEALATQVEITGRLRARQRVELFAEVGGVLLAENSRFEEGNYFKKGQPLIVIDHEEVRLTLLAQKSSLMNQITLLLPDLKTDYPESFPQWEAYLQNFDLKADLAPLPESKNERERYFISARNLYNLYYSIRSQEARLEKYTLEAPFSGMVSAALIDAGTLVRPSQKLGEFLNPYLYELEAAVNLGDIDFIKPGNEVELTAGGVDGSWKGRIQRINSSVDPTTQTLKVYINLSGKDLREGMYLNGSIRGQVVKDVMELPRSLLVNQEAVYVVVDSTLKLQPVEPVKFTTNSVLLRGIPAGSQVIVEPVVGAYEGLKVLPYQAAAN
jgi:membrane fusion protein, multidrug efflux system